MGCTQDDPMFQWDQMDPAIREKELTRNAVARYIEQRQKHKMNMQVKIHWSLKALSTPKKLTLDRLVASFQSEGR